MAGVLGLTHSVCPQCRALVPARVLTSGTDVRFRRYCPAHGEDETTVSHDLAEYLRVQRYVKPAWVPAAFAGAADRPCPDGCGFCSRHEQHLCMPIVEITNRCDLACPICLTNAGTPPTWDLSPADFDRLLDRLLAAERQIDVLNLSGGEPLLHPQLLTIVEAALGRREIVRVSVSTNGLALLRQPGLLAELKARRVVVSLQFDGTGARPYELLRGRDLWPAKQEILAALRAADVTTSLTMTVAAGVNEDQLRPVLDELFATPQVVSLMLQPLAFAGRAATWAGRGRRLHLPDVIALVAAAGHPAVSRDDFVPLPCSHPQCFSLAFYLALEPGRAVAVNRLTPAATLLDALANRVVFGLDPAEHARLKELIYELWSGPAGAVPESAAVLATLRQLLRGLSGLACCDFDPRQAFAVAERQVKSIFIHAFQDAGTFDLARVRRCCQAYPQADGRLLPACVRNVRGPTP